MAMREIIFESHSTSVDNEEGIASGHLDSALSEKGENQAIELGRRYAESLPDVILCSDLQRSYRTAEFAFRASNIPIQKDPRLREWNYGLYNGYSADELEALKSHYLHTPFPEGESLVQAIDRVLQGLDDCLEKFPVKKLLLIGHRSAYYALESRYKGRAITNLVSEPWKWQPGWRYGCS